MIIRKNSSKMKVYYVDTNVFLRFFLKDILVQYEVAEELFKKAKDGEVKLVVAQITIFEIQFVLYTEYHFSKQEIIEKIQSLLAANYLHIQNKKVFKIAIAYFEKSKNSLADCFILAKAQSVNAELFTFDKKLKKQK